MAITSINVGNIANDGTGDDLRDAFIKVNNNFNELDTRVSSFVDLTVNNVGTGTVGLFSRKSGADLEFKTLAAGNNVSLVVENDTVTIGSSGGITAVTLISDTGSTRKTSPEAMFAIYGRDGITTSTSTTGDIKLTLSTNDVVVQDTAPVLGGNLDADGKNIINIGTLTASSLNGPLAGLVYGYDMRDIGPYFNNYWDFGAIHEDRYFNNIIDWLIGNATIDLGSIVNPGVVDAKVDLGFI